MKNRRTLRAVVITLVVVGVVAAVAFIGLRIATETLKNQVQQALGPESEVGELLVRWSGIELHNIRVRAPKGWPAPDTLRAERIVIKPDLIGLFSERVHVPRITVHKPYISVLRTRKGKMRILPSMLEKAANKQEAGKNLTPAVTIGNVIVHGGVLEFFDATVRRPAHKTRLENVEASVDNLHVPSLSGRTGLRLDGVVKGVRRNGTLSIAGWSNMATRDSEIRTVLRGVDLIALQPYLIKAAEAGVRRGTLDLDLNSTVRANRLHAPGKATLANLELSSSGSPFATFMGVPRQAVVASLKNRDGRIRIDFTLEGNLDDPKFSLNENFALRMGAAVAQGLGISLEGLTRGVGGAAEGVGNAVKKLFGR